jgi:hypothetical protein
VARSTRSGKSKKGIDSEASGSEPEEAPAAPAPGSGAGAGACGGGGGRGGGRSGGRGGGAPCRGLQPLPTLQNHNCSSPAVVPDRQGSTCLGICPAVHTTCRVGTCKG